jgi:hypothetical protein
VYIFIIPYKPFRPNNDGIEAEAFDLIAKTRTPSTQEQRTAHQMIEDFVKRPLPKAFFNVPQKGVQYYIYPQKFLPKTWELLRENQLTRELSKDSMSEQTALILMSLLTDCCAGQTLARIIDRAGAYASLTDLFVEQPNGDNPDKKHSLDNLLPISLQIADATSISLKKLVALRKREEGSADGHLVRDLRHRFVERLDKQAQHLSEVTAPTDIEELRQQFKDEMLDDLRDLKEALKLEAQQVVGTKEIIASIATTAATVAALMTGVLPVAISGGLATLGGLIASKSRFVKARHEILKKHPMAYLYEMHGGLRI